MSKSFNEMMARQSKDYIQHHKNEINNLENTVRWHEAKNCKEPKIARCYLYKDDYIYIVQDPETFSCSNFEMKTE